MSETSSLEAPSIEPDTLSDDLGTNAAGLERRLLIAMSGGVFLAASWIGSMLGSNQLVSQFPAAIGSIILVIPLLIGAWGEISRGRPSSDSLASLAVLAAMSSEMYLAAGFLALFLCHHQSPHRALLT